MRPDASASRAPHACTVAFGAMALVAALLSGCAVSRGGLAEVDASVADARMSDARAEDDLGSPDADAGGCAPGTVDLNGDATDGCECLVAPERCNGRDDDCDPSTPDGADEATLGEACDGLDSDRCAEGMRVCSDGALACSDTSDDTRELCATDADDDCDGQINEADAVDTTIFYPDADGDGHARGGVDMAACAAPPGTLAGPVDDCDDMAGTTFPGAVDECNGVDDDCNGIIDDGDACPCSQRRREGSVYLFCTSGKNFADAETACMRRGYHLATIEDTGEAVWLFENAREDASMRQWWVGYNDVATEGSFVWTSGATSAFTDWLEGEPSNSGGGGGEDCVELNLRNDPGWNDSICSESNYFVCEVR
jgi:hypothetical protein